MNRRYLCRALMLSASVSMGASAQTDPGSLHLVPFDKPAPEARDIPYPGVISVSVDATDVLRGIFQIEEVFPVSSPGPLTLLYPKWIAGYHSPSGPVSSIAALTILAANVPLAWQRDPIDTHAFTIDVPSGISAVKVRFQFLSPTTEDDGDVRATPDMLNLKWTETTLYPAGYFISRIPVAAKVRFPRGFKSATALEVTSAHDDTVSYRTVSYDVLADSPIYAGRYFRRDELCPSVFVNVIGDTPGDINIAPAALEAHRRICQQMLKLFGQKHYDHYDFLLSISDTLALNGLEHLRSSENGVRRGYFTEWDQHLWNHDLLSHEYAHSWNGKFRRPAGLWTPDFRTPMRNSLLWVYEGQTQLWGHMISARAGMLSKQDVLDEWAATVAEHDTRAGHRWRSVEDTTFEPILAIGSSKTWPSWELKEEYYDIGALAWLDVNAVIYEKSGGKRSLNDFARAFFGMRTTATISTYTLDDIIQTLNAIQPYDWKGFFQSRIYQPLPQVPMDWIAKGGYRLVFTPISTRWIESTEKEKDHVDLSFSLGIVVGNSGAVKNVVWDGPAFKESLTRGAEIVGVGDQVFSSQNLRDAVTKAAVDRKPIKLVLKKDDHIREVNIPYYDGLRYPHLVKASKADGSLDELFLPLK